MSPPPPLWFRAVLVSSGVGLLAYQRLLPEPVATFWSSPLVSVLLDRPMATPPDADAALLGLVPPVVAGLLAATAVRRKAGAVAIAWRAAAGAIGSLLCLIWFAFAMPNLWPTALLLLGGAGLAVWGLRLQSVDSGGLATILLCVVANGASHFFVPLSNLGKPGHGTPWILGVAAAAFTFAVLRLRPFAWHGPPAVARRFAAFCAFAVVTPVAGYFDVGSEAYGCSPPAPGDCPAEGPELTWLQSDTDEVYYGIHVDPPRDQVVALARARYCEDGTTARAAFVGLEDGAVHGVVDMPDCDRAYDAPRPDPDRMVAICASGPQSLDLRNRAYTTPPKDEFTDFEAESAIERSDGSWWVSGVDKGVIARFDPVTLQETGRWWMADNVHLATRLHALDAIEPGLFLFASSSSVMVLGPDFEVRARRETLGINLFLGVDPLRARAYVTDPARKLLRVWSLPDLEPVGTVPLDDGAYFARSSPETGLLAVSYFGGSTVALFDADTLELRRTVEVGPGPRGLDFDLERNRLVGTSRCGIYAAELPGP